MVFIFSSNRLRLLFLICLLGLFVPAGGEGEEGKGQGRVNVAETDCSKCHENIVFSLRIKGKAHQPLCLECHQGHPPNDVDIIPRCSRCHEGSEHYSLDGCLLCHTDPHTPLEIDFTRKFTDACLSCHKSQIEQLKDNPSIHTKLACTACHNYHGQVQPCSNCHLPHSDTMGDKSCGGCHKAHMPLVVNYGDNIVSEDCGSCHVDEYTMLVTNSSKHREVRCVVCHSAEHGFITECEQCHGRPHAETILARFDHCGDCHGSAHDLWGAATATSKFVLGKGE